MNTKIPWSILTILLLSLNMYAQNVGIGTTTPSATLHVNGDVISDSLKTPFIAPNYYERVYADLDGVLFVGRTETYSIHPSKFTGSSATIRYNPRYVYDNSTGNSTLYAEVNLPYGAQITKIRASVYDNAAGEDLLVQLNSVIGNPVPTFCSSNLVKASVISAGASTNTQFYSDTTIECYDLTDQQFITIQPANGGTWANGNLRLAGIWITYTY